MTKHPDQQFNLHGNKIMAEYTDDAVGGTSGGNSISAGQVKALLVKIPFSSYEEHEGRFGVFRSLVITTLNGKRVDGSVITRDTVELVFSSKRLKYLLDTIFNSKSAVHIEDNTYLIEGTGSGFDRHYKISEVSIE